MKVIKAFYCIKTKTNYNKGDEYKGSRKDVNSFLEIIKEPIKAKVKKTNK